MATYESYKDSGVAWIGEIPSEWKVDLLSMHLYDHCIYNIDLSEKNLLSLSYGNIVRKNIETKEGLLPASFNHYNVIDEGDIVLRLTDLQNDKKSLRTGLCKEHGIITSAYLTLRKRSNDDSDYLHYLLHCYDICKVFYGMGNGVRQGMNYSDMRKLPLIIPSLAEQRRIATFLDEKCADIDALITLQEQMIEELKAYKQSVITEAVTKGLDPNAKMKDSGVEWIGEIPEEWKICKLQYIANLQSGHNLTTEQITENGLYPVFGGNGIRGYYHQYSDDGDYVIIGRQGALCGNINYAHGKFWPTEHAVVCYPKIKYNYIWFGETLRTMNLGQYSFASAQPGLSVERIKQLSLPLPPLSVQRSIAAYLDEKTSQIDELIALKNNKIEELKEYKKSVIYEYVTGKKKV